MTKREAVPKNLATVFHATDRLVQARDTLPALILVYASIDILASLQRNESEGTRRAFVRWADTYLLPGTSLRCRGIDLYAARCAILHTLTPDAELVRNGEARKIIYAWGAGDPKKLEEAARRLGYDYAAIHIGELHDATKAAATRFFEAVDASTELTEKVERAAGQWLIDVSTTTMDLLLARTGGWPAA